MTVCEDCYEEDATRETDECVPLCGGCYDDRAWVGDDGDE